MKFLNFKWDKTIREYIAYRIIKRNGSVLVVFSLLMPIFLIFTGLIIDIGSAMSLKEELNKACLIAAEESSKNIDIEQAQKNGINNLKDNCGSEINRYFFNNIKLSKNFELTSLNYEIVSGFDDPRFIEVICEARFKTYFLKIFGIENINIHSNGIGRLRKIK